MILPIVKERVGTGGKCRIPTTVTYSFAEGCDIAVLGAEAFATFAPGAEKSENGFVRFLFDGALEERAEIYKLKVLEDGIEVSFRDARGAVNGAATAALLLRKPELETLEIVDYPSFSYRSVMIDMARGLPTWEDMEYAVRYAALAKLNRLHLHLMDSRGLCYLSDVVPEITYAESSCDKAFIRGLVELCRSYAIEIVPEIEIPAHATKLCEAHPEFKCEVPSTNGWALCAGAEGVLPLFDKLIGEITELFPGSEYIHIGSDEIEFRDIPGERYCYWDDCPRCAALRAREGLKDRQEEYYYLVNRVHELVLSHGRKMMMWGDQIDVSRDEVPLSRDILVEFWRVAGRGRGPHDGCSLEKLLEHGFTVVNAYYPYTYFDEDGYMTSEKMKTWTPLTNPETSAKHHAQIIGGEACAWEYGNYANYPFYPVVTPAALALFGDKVWAGGEREHGEQFRAALSELLFGDGSLADVFDYIGALLPPTTKDKLTFAEPESLSRSGALECASRLRACGKTDAAKSYALRLEKIGDSLK